MIRGSIFDEVWQAGYFSLMTNETKDISKQLQLAIVLRVVASLWSHANDKIITLSSAYENNLGLLIRNKLKTSI